MASQQRTVRVPASRLARWVANFETGHGDTAYAVRDGALLLTAADGSTAALTPPYDRLLDVAEVDALAATCVPPDDWGLLLVRKGGFAVARLNGPTTVTSKVGRRHVQGKTKAGGQSQQRFARRRDNQAREAYAAAAGHAARLLVPEGGEPAPLLVLGGDAAGVASVLEDPRLRALREAVVGDLLDVPDPRRDDLEAAATAASAVTIVVRNA